MTGNCTVNGTHLRSGELRRTDRNSADGVATTQVERAGSTLATTQARRRCRILLYGPLKAVGSLGPTYGDVLVSQIDALTSIDGLK